MALEDTLLMKLVSAADSLLSEVIGMFRAEHKQLANESVLKMEGRLVGDWANEAKALLSYGPVPKALIVDLTEVSYVDAVGEQVLTWMGSLGARFVAKAVYAAEMCKRLKLPVHNKPTPTKTVFRAVLVTQDGSD